MKGWESAAREPEVQINRPRVNAVNIYSSLFSRFLCDSRGQIGLEIVYKSS